MSIFSESDCLASKSSSFTWIESRFRMGLIGRLSSVEGPHDTRRLPLFPLPLHLLHLSGTAQIMFFSGFKGEMAPCFLIFACLTITRSSAGSSFSSSKCSCNWSLLSGRSARKIHAEPPRCLRLDNCRYPRIRFASGSRSRFQASLEIQVGVCPCPCHKDLHQHAGALQMLRESHSKADLATTFVACFQPRGPHLAGSTNHT